MISKGGRKSPSLFMNVVGLVCGHELKRQGGRLTVALRVTLEDSRDGKSSSVCDSGQGSWPSTLTGRRLMLIPGQ